MGKKTSLAKGLEKRNIGNPKKNLGAMSVAEKEALEAHIKEVEAAVVSVSRGMEVLAKSRLKHKTLLLLISHSSRVSQTDVEKVLNALETLEKTYLK